MLMAPPAVTEPDPAVVAVEPAVQERRACDEPCRGRRGALPSAAKDALGGVCPGTVPVCAGTVTGTAGHRLV